MKLIECASISYIGWEVADLFLEGQVLMVHRIQQLHLHHNSLLTHHRVYNYHCL